MFNFIVTTEETTEETVLRLLAMLGYPWWCGLY